MNIFVRIVFLVAAAISTAVYAGADTGNETQPILTSFDFNIVGVGLKASPDYQAVPKGIASKVNASFEAAGFDLANLVAQLPKDCTVRAELSGPAFQTPIPLVTKPGTAFDLPTLAVTGRYTLANIRLVDGNGTTLFGAVPQVVAIESIPDPLITSVTTRQLTVQELQDRGVTFDESNFTAYEFTAAIGTSSGQIQMTLPVVIPSSQVVQSTPTINAPSTISIPQPKTITIPPEVPVTAVPQNLTADPFLMEVDDKEVAAKVQLPPIPGVVVIPGNIGFLHEYFSALVLVSNGAPLQSGLKIRDVTATISFPAGEDLTPGTDQNPGDDPLRMAKGTSGYFPRTMSVKNAGPDGKAGTADDISSLKPAESGQADFTIEGRKEGTHKVDFEITAILDGLPIGPVTLKGKTTGAVLVRNPDFAVTLGHPSTIRVGEEYDLFVTVSNTGKSTANLVTVGLDPRALSGTAFADGEANSKSIDTILPGSSATVKFRLKSQRTGAVTATAFESETVKGHFILRAGVGEKNIPLSPDSLILPYTGALPSDLITAAVGLLGQAWSVATAPTGALPADVLPISKQTVTSRAYDLSEAGLRVLIGDNLIKAAQDLSFDFLGSDVYNKGFDSLRRFSTQGLELNRSLAAVFKTDTDTSGAIAFQAGFADKVSYRPGHISVISSDAPLRLRLTDSSNNRCGGLNATEKARSIPYADFFTLGENGTSRVNLLMATRIDSSSYTLDLTAEGAGSFDLGVVVPNAGGVLTQYIFSGLSLSAGARGSLAIVPGSGNLVLALDDNGDGIVDRTLAPSSAVPVPDHAPHIVAVTQLTPNFGPGGDKHGRNVAVLFSERVTKESAQNAANYGVDENNVKQAVLQPGNRMAFLLLRDGIGPFFDRSLTAQGLTDKSGKSMTASESLPIRITAQGPAAVVTGTVRTARGEPVPNATVRLYQLIWYDDGFEIYPRYALFTEKQANSDGSYRLEYVLQNDPTGVDPSGPFQIEAVNPITKEAGSLITGVMFHGQRLQLDIFMKAKGSLSGVVRNEAGNPVGGATVQVITLADNRGQTKTTDAAGTFSFSNLMVGAYSLKAVSQATLSEGSTMGTLPEDGAAVSQDVTIRRVADVVRGTVVGKVLGSDGVTPRAGVIAIVEGPNYKNWQRTAADGSFSFSGVYAGTIKVTARDDSTGEQSESGGVISTTGQIITLNLIMKGTGSVTGLVKRDDGKSAEGLYVIATFSVAPGIPPLSRLQQTNADGAFRFDLIPIGNVSIQVLDPRDFNHTVASGTVTILSAGDTANIVLVVPLKALATGTIQGTVYHRDGSVWANAPVWQLVGMNAYYVRTADASGHYSIANLPLGGYKLTVISGNEVINASTDLWTEVRTLDLRPVGFGKVTGTTYDDAGKTIPTGADVTLYSVKPNQVGWLVYDPRFPDVVKSDPQTGRFAFNNVFLGSFTVSSSNIFRPTPVSQSGALVTDGQVVNVDLPLKGTPSVPGEPVVNQPGSVSGRVLMPDGSAAGKDVRVTLTFGGADVTVTTDEQGLFAFRPIIPAGNQAIQAEDPVTTLKWKGYVSVPSGLDVPITIKLLGRGMLTVKVLDATGNTVIPDAKIDVRGTDFPNDFAEGTTDASGQAVFNNLTQGNYAVSANGILNLAGLSGRVQATIPGENANVTAEVRLTSYGTVTGRFLKADGQTPIAGGQVTLIRGGQTLAYTTSSSDGGFTMQYVPLGDFSTQGFDPITERRGVGGGRLLSDGQTVVADVIVTPRGTVKGIVLNNSGSAPVNAASVSISVSGVTSYSYTTITGPDGTFLFAGVPAGRFTVDAKDTSNELHGQSTASLSYEGETVETQVHIAPTGSIAGRVLMPDGVTPVFGATVLLNGGTPQQVEQGTGAFRYDNLAAGRSYSLSTSQPNTQRNGSTVAAINHDGEVANGDIILHGVGTVQGIVYLPNGKDVPSVATVELNAGNFNQFVNTTDGSFSFVNIPNGPFSLKASAYGMTTGASASGNLQTEGQVANINLVFGDVADVTGLVLLADGVTPSRGGGIRLTTSTGSILIGITDSNGRFSFTKIPVPCNISIYVEDAAGVGIGGFNGKLDKNGLDTGTIVLDDKPIFVTSINPSSGASGVPLNQQMHVLFSEPANPATVNSSTVYLTQGNNRVNGTLSLDPDNTGVTFTPSAQLSGFTLYTLVVTDGITDLLGQIHKLAQPQSTSFTTIDNIPPTVVSISPATGAVQITSDAVVRMTFSEQIDPNSLAGIILTSGGVPVPARADLIQNGMVVALTPLEPLSYNRDYTATVSGLRDLAGNLMLGSVQSVFTTIDTVSPTVTSLSIPSYADPIKGGTIAVTAVTPDTDVAFIDFYLDDQLAGSAVKAPFTFPVLLPRVGAARIKAIAQDRVGNRGVASPFLDLQVKQDTPPQAYYLSPAEGSSVDTGSSFTVTVEGIDDMAIRDITLTASGEITGTQTLANSNGGKTFSAAFNLTAPATVAGNGSIVLSAIARDSGGSQTQPIQRTLVLRDGTPPSAILSSPGQSVKYKPGETALITVAATDNMSLASITCTASGAATASQSFTIDPGLTGATKIFSFAVPGNAAANSAINVSCAASDAAANSKAASLTLTVADTIPPVVSSSSVAGNSSVAISAEMTLVFSKALDPATVTAASVILSESATGTPVPAAVSVSGDRKTVTLKPSSKLVRATGYTLAVTTAVTDDIGNAVAVPYSVNFTTDGTPPAVVSASPSDGSIKVPLGTTITVRFNEQIDPSSVVADQITLASSSGPVSGSVSVSNDGLAVIFKPNNQLGYSRTYTFVLKAGVRDISGNVYTADNSTASFTTQGPDADLVGYWPMDGDWKDFSGKGNNGVAYGSATFSTGIRGGTQAGSFDGNSAYVQAMMDAPEYNFSIEAWAKSDSPGGLFSVTAGSYYGSGGHDRHVYINNDGFACFRVWQGNGWCTNKKVNDGSWHHWMLVAETGVGQKAYLDGKLIDTNAYDHSDFNTQDRVVIGYSADVGYFKGLIDEVSFYKRPLQAEDVLERYNAGLTADRTSPDAPSLVPVAASTYNPLVLLRGTKDVGASIRINDKQVVEHDSSTTWQVLYRLSIGQNLLDITSRDIAGNASLATSVAIELLPMKQKDPSIVGLWHMDGDWKDYAGNGFDGNANNGPAFISDRVAGTSAGSFRGGSDYVAVGNLYGNFPDNAFTIGAWVKLDDTGGGSKKIIAGGTGSNSDYAIGLTENQFTVFTYNKSTGFYAKSGFVPEIGKWYYVAGVYDGSRLKLYVNGELKNEYSAGWVQNNGGVDFRIGDGSGNNFNGLIDEVALNNRALSAQEILDRYNSAQQISITSPGQSTRYKAGETGTATVSASSAAGIAKLYCNASGAVDAGTLVIPFDPPQAQITQGFTFHVTSDAGQSAPIRISCVTESIDGSFGSVDLDILAADLVAPVITSLTVPPATDLIRGNIVTVTAAIADTDVAFVDFYVDGQQAGSVSKPPYTLQVALNKEGLTQVKAIAQDLIGNRGVEATLDLQVLANASPQVTITSPSEGGSVYTGNQFYVYVNGADDLNLKDITLTSSGELVSTQTKLVSGKSADTYFYLTAPVAITQGGTITLTATARDSVGNISVATQRNLVLRDGTYPNISLSSPGQTVNYKPGETASISISNSDNMGVTKIECSASGAASASQTFNLAPAVAVFSFPIPSDAAPYATVNVYCSAYDAAGNRRNASLGLTVADIVPPAIISVTPADGATQMGIKASVIVNFSEAMASAGINANTVKLAEKVSGAVVQATVTLSADGKTVTLKPASDLIRGLGYTLSLVNSITDLAGNPLPSYSGSFTADGTAPEVAGIIPAGGSANVLLDTAITVRFSEPVDPASITPELISFISQNLTLSGSQSLSSDGLTLTFKPYSQLSRSRNYTFTLKAGVRDLSGNALAADATTSFTTTKGIDADLVGYWPMNGDWNDYSGKGNNLSANGMAFSTDAVGSGQSAQFGWNSYLEKTTPSGDLNVGNQSWTISAWVKTSPSSSGQMTIVERNERGKYGSNSPDGNSNALYNLQLDNNGFASFRVMGDNGQTYTVTDDANLRDSAWHFMAGVIDRSSGLMRIFVDGEEKKSTSIAGLGAINDVGSPLVIGSSTYYYYGDMNHQYYFSGLVDEVSIYKQALAPEDIVEIYNAALTTDRTPPAAPTVEPVTSPTYTNIVLLRGTKPAGTSIRINENPVVAHDGNTTWQILYPLVPGQNLLNATCRDKAGNVSASIEIVINVILSSAEGTILNTNMTADNGYHIYISTNENVVGTEFGSANNWSNSYSFSTKLTPNVINYLHVYAYDQGGIAGLIGELNLLDNRFKFNNGTQNLVTNTTDWRVYRDTFGGTQDAVTNLGTNGVSPWGGIPNISSKAIWIWTHDAYGDDVAYFSTAITPQTPTISITSPGQTVRYKAGESGTATVAVSSVQGISRLYCNASGAVSEGTLVVPFDPPQSQVTQDFTFRVAADAKPAAPIKLSCVAEAVDGTLGSADLSMLVADLVPPQITLQSPADGTVYNNGDNIYVAVSGTDNIGLKDIVIETSGELISTKSLPANGVKSFSTNLYLSVPIPITHDGKIVLTATARDLAGNLSQPVVRTLLVHDSVSPTISLSTTDVSKKYKPGDLVSVTINAGDNAAVTNVSCTAAGSPKVNDADPLYGSQTFTLSPPQTSTSQSFSFSILPLSAYKFSSVAVTCTAFDATDNKTNATLQLALADIKSPAVTSSSPVDNSINALLNGVITLNFSEPLALNSVSTASIALTNRTDGSTVPVNLSLSSDHKTVTVKPASALARGASYTLTVSTVVTDESGNPLAAPYELHFTTGSLPLAAQTIVPVPNSVNVPVGTVVSIRFNQAIDPASVTQDMVSLVSSGSPVAGTASVSSDGLTLNFKPNAKLTASGTYLFTLNPGVRDLSGTISNDGLSFTFATQADNSDLMGYWPMDNDWSDYSGNGINGTANGGVGFTPDSLAGTAAGTFNGTDGYVRFASTNAVYKNPEISVEAWVFPTEVTCPSGENGRDIYSESGAYGKLLSLGINCSGKVEFRFYNATTITSSVPVAASSWCHLVATKDASGTKLYVNGVLSGRNDANIQLGDAANYIYDVYAGYGYNSSRKFAGRIDDLAVYKRALAHEDVVEHFNAALTSLRALPAAPTVEPVVTPTSSNAVLLRGTKEKGTSVRVNGRQIVAHDMTTTWQSLYSLVLGQNQLEIASHDQAGNISPAVALSVELLQNTVPDVVALWHMDGNWQDYSGNNNNGTASGAQFSNDAHTGASAGRFYGNNTYSGNAFISLPTGNQARTIAAWVKVDSGYNDRRILSYGNGSYYDFELYVDSSNRAAMRNNHYNTQSVSGTSNIADGKWHYVAGVFEGPESYLGKIFVDGVLENSAPFTSTSTPSGSFRIGSCLWDYTSFNGLIDELVVYKRALTDEEISALSTTSPVVSFVTPMADTRFRPGEAGSVTVNASHPQGITRLSCNASGAAGEGSMVVPFESPQTQVTQQFTFKPAADASPYASIRLTCVAETSSGALGSANLDIQVGDVVRPTVTSASISDNAINVSTTQSISISFSESINPASLTSDTVILKLASTGSTQAGSITLTPDGKQLVFNSTMPLECGTAYVLTVSAASLRDVAGNALGSDYVLHFTTQSPTSPVIENQGAYDAPYVLSGGKYDTITIRNSYVVVDGALFAGTVNLESGAVLTHKPTGQYGMELLDLTISGALNVDDTSSIDVTGRGYQANRTAGNKVLNGNAIAGGSYGGIGAGNNAGTDYGDLADPKEPGSGAWKDPNRSFVPGSGGGLVRIKAATIKLDGEIVADGDSDSESGYNTGSGSGGGIRIDVGTLSGSGTISADGGSDVNIYGGGGGRVAIYYDAMTLPRANISAAGGYNENNPNQSDYTGGAGAVYLKDNARTAPGLIIDNGGHTTNNATTIPGSAYEFLDVKDGAAIEFNGAYSSAGDMVLDNVNWTIDGQLNVTGNLIMNNSTLNVSGGVTSGGDLRMTKSNLKLKNDLIVAGGVNLVGNSILSHAAATLTDAWMLNIKAVSVVVDSSSQINVSGKGYLGGSGDNAGRTKGNLPGSSGRNGGSYGGSGGVYSNWEMPDSNAVLNATYGDPANPNDLGSGGGSGGNSGGAGGGLVRIKATSVTIDGSIIADGGYSSTSGSGGGILVDVSALSGSGTISANGSFGYSGVGGGGRIAVYYDTMSFPVTHITALGVTSYFGNAQNSGAGTVYLKNNSKTGADLIVNNNGTQAPEGSTPLRTVGRGTIAVINGDSLVMAGAAWTPGDFKGMKINPNLKQAKTFTIRDNTVDTIFIESSEGNLNDVAAVGDTFSGVVELSSLKVINRAGMTVNGLLKVAGEIVVDNATLTAVDVLADTVSVINGGKMTHSGATTTMESRLSVAAASSITVDATSGIDVSGRGYLGGNQGGNGMNGRTLGNVSGSVGTTGGSYGGYGGYINNGKANDVYGNLSDPDELGSGGGSSQTDLPSGNGGGLVRLKAPVVTLDGNLAANGMSIGSDGYYSGGGGSGGGIRIDAGTLKGTGSISSSGATGSAGGSGGRIALYFDSMTLPKSSVSAVGGNAAEDGMALINSPASGAAGTIYLKDNAKAKPELIVNNGGNSTANATPVAGVTVPGLVSVSGEASPYGSVDVGGGAVIGVQGDFIASGDLTLNNTGLTIDGALSLTKNLSLNSCTLNVSGGLAVPGNLSMTAGRLSLKDALSVSGSVTLNNSILTHYAATADNVWKLDLTAASITVDTSSSIDVSGKGYLGGYYDETTQAYVPARTRGNLPGSSGNNGGSYGGFGGRGYDNSVAGNVAYGAAINSNAFGSGGSGDNNSATVNVPYGDFANPSDVGSGGSGQGTGGAGGGLIRITADSVALEGSIRADGSSDAGGGSGGGIRMDVGVLSGSGTISASGGDGYSSHNGGGGGRIAVYYNTLSLPSANIIAAGIDNSGGGAGTIYLKDKAKSWADLTVDNNGSDAPEESTVIRTVERGAIAVITGDSLTMTGAAWNPGEFKGMKVNPNLKQAKAFTIRDNTADTIFIEPSEGNLNNVAAVGDTFGGVVELNSLRVANRAGLGVNGLLKVAGALVVDNANLTAGDIQASTISVINGGNVTHTATNTTTENRLTLKVSADLTIDAGSRIDVSGRGYLGGFSFGNDQPAGRTLGNIIGSTAGSGGSYGGLGGINGGIANEIYGDQTNPGEPGSGGGSDTAGCSAGNGGGYIRITAATLTLGGNILADGGAAPCTAAGGGSGGGIRLDVGSLLGAGAIAARGGGSDNGAGGGGRIAIYSTTNTLLPENVIASGGKSGDGSIATRNGGNGTVYYSLLP